MFKAAFLGLALLWVISGWAQSAPDNQGAANNQQDDSRMLIPPPISGEAYSTVPASEMRSNYLRAGVVFNTTYTDNLLGGVTPTPISDLSYSIWPTIEFGQTRSTWDSLISYSPGFTFYQKTTSRDETDQNANADFKWRLSPHVSASIHDSFQKASNVYNQPDLISASAVSATPEGPNIIPPVADRLNNTAHAELTYQFSLNGMVGAAGTFSFLDYPDPSEVPGLYNSNSRAGSAFYSRRLSKRQYMGVLYEYNRIVTYPVGPQVETETHTPSVFYTIYLKPTLSFSVSGGPQHYDVTESGVAGLQSWVPSGAASFGWQAGRIALAGSYSRTVTGGGGLIGGFDSNSVSAALRCRVAHAWTVGSAASYAINQTLTPSLFTVNPGGHSIFGTISLQHPIGQHYYAEVGYTRVHQSYGSIAAIAGAPDTNREYISIGYQFTRPLGR